MKELFNYKIIFVFVDIIVFFVLLKKMKNFVFIECVVCLMCFLYFVLIVVIFFVNLGFVEVECLELLICLFDCVMFVKNLGLYVY